MGKCFPSIRAKLINPAVFEQLVQSLDRCDAPFANHIGHHPARFGGISVDQPAFALFLVPNTTPVPVYLDRLVMGLFWGDPAQTSLAEQYIQDRFTTGPQDCRYVLYATVL